jgi:hypothetical protein
MSKENKNGNNIIVIYKKRSQSMKRFIKISAIFSLLLSVVGCSCTNPMSSTTTNTTTKPTTSRTTTNNNSTNNGSITSNQSLK